jgi:probable phosphoglycerate mutase
MRHGQSEANVQGLIISNPTIGIERYGLTRIGRQQVAQSLATAAASLPAELQIISSDFLRARQTAAITHRQLACVRPVEYSALLRERYFGDYDGASDVGYSEVWQRDKDDAEQQQGDVESVAAVLARTSKLIQQLETKQANQAYLLIAHGDTLQILQTAFLAKPAAEHRALQSLAVAEVRSLGCWPGITT